MPDFTSALFLGLHHGSASLGGWDRLTTGRPAALGEPAVAVRVAARVARAQGAAAGVVHRSTLHALSDVLVLAARRCDVVLVDDGAYPIARLAATQARLRVLTYPHHDVAAARRVAAREGGRPVIVTDGWCAGCNRAGPLVALEGLARASGGLLVVDDTQATGVLGRRGFASSPSAEPSPFGVDGGGTFRWLGTGPGTAVVVASLAKGYGAPLTVTCGPPGIVDRLRTSGSRAHSSPPTAVDLLAADSATRDSSGTQWRRRRLARLVITLRTALRALRLPALGLPFPLVHTMGATAEATRALYRYLLAHGVRALLLAPRCLPGMTLSFAVTADHTLGDVRETAAVLAAARTAGVAA